MTSTCQCKALITLTKATANDRCIFRPEASWQARISSHFGSPYTFYFIGWQSTELQEEWQCTTQWSLTEAKQQLANISQQAGPTSGSVFTINKSSEQCSHQCLGKSLHHPSDLLPSWILFFCWTEINWGPMSETGKLHKNEQWNKAGTMTNSDSSDALLHIVHVKISSYQRISCKKHRMPLL